MKTYKFTEIEMYALRDALVEEYQRLREFYDKHGGPVQPHFRAKFKALEALKEQFKTDVAHIRVRV